MLYFFTKNHLIFNSYKICNNKLFNVLYLKNNIKHYKSVNFKVKKKLYIITSILIRWLEFILRTKVQFYILRFDNNTLTSNYNLNYKIITKAISQIYIKYRLINSFFFLKKKDSEDFFNVFFFSIKINDTKPIINWLYNMCKKLQIKDHRSLYSKMCTLLDFFCKLFKNTYKIWGWFFRVSGKISVTGNAMSRIYFKSNGKIAVNNLKLKVSFDTILIRTITGCSNVFLYFLYK